MNKAVGEFTNTTVSKQSLKEEPESTKHQPVDNIDE